MFDVFPYILEILKMPLLPFRDDTPHVPNEDLGERAVLDIIGNLTEIIMQVFPGKRELTKGYHR